MTPPKRLLVVDDETAFADLVVKVAAELGYEAKAAYAADSFQALYLQHDPDVIVLDVILPEMDGIELIRWLIANRCRARILVLSGGNPLFATAVARIGADQGGLSVKVASKPISLSDLRAFLAEPTEGKSA